MARPTLALLLSLLLQTTTTHDLTDISASVFGEDKYRKIIPAAFGDFNSDKLTDMVVLRENPRDMLTVGVMLATKQSIVSTRSDGPYFETPQAKERLQCSVDDPIVGAIPADFDGDGGMDILLVTQNTDFAGYYDATVLWGNHSVSPERHELVCLARQRQEWRKELKKLAAEPMVLDYNGDYVADILIEEDGANRTVLLLSKDRAAAPERQTLPSPPGVDRLKRQHASSYLDLSGDGAADIVLTTIAGLEMYENKGPGRYEYHGLVRWPDLGKCEADQCVGQIVFADFDLTGTLDLILPMCFDTECSNSTIYLVSVLELWKEAAGGEGARWKWIPMSLDLGEFRFLPSKPENSPLQLMAPRVGDVDLDGFPDLVMPLYNSTAGITDRRAHLLLNVPCRSFTGCHPFWRKFQVQPGYTAGTPNTILATFFDLFEDGRQDLIGVSGDSKNGHTISAFTNTSQDSDAYFIKVIVLSGVCYHNCDNNSIDVPYGTNSGGQTISYQSQRPGPETFAEYRSTASQLTQTNSFALQLPYTIFGLGMAPNFVDYLAVNISRRSHSWPQIIPNSQVYIIPYPPDHPEQWEAKLFIYASKSITFTGLALVGTCFLVSLIILGLHLRERRQDHQAKLQEAHRFHFDAM